MDRPFISSEAFSRLVLRVGTVLSARRHPRLPALSVVEVQLEERVEALAPAPSAPEDLAGRRVVVAGALHPLSTGSESYRYSLLTDRSTPVRALAVASEVPDGSRLY